MTRLTALSPLDGRYATQCEPLQAYFSEYALIRFRVEVEARWLLHLSNIDAVKALPALPEKAILEIIESFDEKDAERVKAIESEINHDVKAVEYFLKEKLESTPEIAPHLEFIHFGCTSEDINNLAYALMLKQAMRTVITPALEAVMQLIQQHAHSLADAAMLSRTHGQSASPTTMGKELFNFYKRLENQFKALSEVKFYGKLNGAVGNYNALHACYPGVDWPDVSQHFIENTLGLSFQSHSTQIEPHDNIAALCHVLMRINRILTDYSQDIWTYISRAYFVLARKEQEVGSSTMPHKVNPIDFENAEGNLGLANALLGFFADKLTVSRLQRDLSDSTVLRNLGSALGYCLIAYRALEKGTTKLTFDRDFALQELNDHWEVLTEAIQMILRREGLAAPYEQLKALSRGKQITQDSLHRFIDQLDVKDAIKQEMKALTPEHYLGLASPLSQ